MAGTGQKPSAVAEAAWKIIMGWMIPGLGHFLAGHRVRGVCLCLLIGGAFLAGLILSDFEAVSRDLHPYSFFAQIWIGSGSVPLLLLDPASTRVLHGQDTIQRYETVPPHNATGVLFCSIAGILNLLLLFDLADRLLGGRPATAQALREGAR